MPWPESESLLRALDQDGVSTPGCMGHAVFGVLAEGVVVQRKHEAHSAALGDGSVPLLKQKAGPWVSDRQDTAQQFCFGVGFRYPCEE